MWASICLLRLIQRLPRNPFFTNNPPILYLFYLHSDCTPASLSQGAGVTRNEAQGRAHGIHKTIEYRANIMRTRTLHMGNGKGTTSARLVWLNVDEKVSRGNFITGSLKKTFTMSFIDIASCLLDRAVPCPRPLELRHWSGRIHRDR